MGKEHSISLINRSDLKVNGVSKIESSDEALVSLRTGLGLLMISGEGLYIKTLNLEDGLVSIGGEIDGVRYENKDIRVGKKKSTSILSRLLK